MSRKKIIGLLLFLSGCMVGPNYRPPENYISAEWNGLPEELNVDVSNELPLIDWWNVFGDPLLTKYIEYGVNYNNDVLKAEANILQARGMRTVAASSLFPKINADFNGLKAYFSKNGPIFSNPAATLPFSQILSLYNAFFDATWEIDLFGKTRRAVQAADANIDSAIEQKNDTLLTVLSEISLNYMEFRGNQKLIILIEENIRLLEENLQIVQEQFEKGLANKLDVENILAQLAQERSLLPELHAQIYRGIYTISILTGNLPETLVDELMPPQELPKVPDTIAVGIRSDLLRRRPDVRYAERQLAVATANVGVAVASFFPSITLFGGIGFDSLKIKNLFTWRSRDYLYGGNISMPIFQGGNLVGNLRISQAASIAAAASYQQTVLTALENSESALVTYSDAQAKVKELEANVEATRTVTDLTKERFVSGLVGLLDYIAQARVLNSAKQSLVQSDVTQLVDLIALYKSLGGGWEIKEGCE